MFILWEESRQPWVSVRFTMALHPGLALAVIQAPPERFFYGGVSVPLGKRSFAARPLPAGESHWIAAELRADLIPFV